MEGVGASIGLRHFGRGRAVLAEADSRIGAAGSRFVMVGRGGRRL